MNTDEQKLMVCNELLPDLISKDEADPHYLYAHFRWKVNKEPVTRLEWLEIVRQAELRLDNRDFGGSLSLYDKYAWELSSRFGRSIRASIEERLECLARVYHPERFKS